MKQIRRKRTVAGTKFQHDWARSTVDLAVHCNNFSSDGSGWVPSAVALA